MTTSIQKMREKLIRILLHKLIENVIKKKKMNQHNTQIRNKSRAAIQCCCITMEKVKHIT